MEAKQMKIKKITVLALVLAMVMTSTVFVFADGEDGGTQTGGTEVTTGTEQPEQPVTPPDPDAEKIAKYGYYHGQNATHIPVLTYHMVMSDKQKKKAKYRRSSLAVSQSTFDKQVKYLVDKGYRTINCDEFYLWYMGKINLPPRSVLITFDDGYIGVATYALPVLKKYNAKGTCFIVGTRTANNKKNTIGYNMMMNLRASQDNLEFQSHTYALHKKFKKKGEYEKVMNDAAKQKAMYGFEYLAYPYGRNTAGMRAAYAASGIKLAFTYGKNAYATRSQNIYQIRRIKVDGRKSFKKFTKWVG